MKVYFLPLVISTSHAWATLRMEHPPLELLQLALVKTVECHHHSFPGPKAKILSARYL